MSLLEKCTHGEMTSLKEKSRPIITEPTVYVLAVFEGIYLHNY